MPLPDFISDYDEMRENYTNTPERQRAYQRSENKKLYGKEDPQFPEDFPDTIVSDYQDMRDFAEHKKKPWWKRIFGEQYGSRGV